MCKVIKYSRWNCGILHHVLINALFIIHSAWAFTDRFRTLFSIGSTYFAFQYRGSHSRSICRSKVLSLSGKIAVKYIMPFFIESDITLVEICGTLRMVWGDAKRVAEGF